MLKVATRSAISGGFAGWPSSDPPKQPAKRQALRTRSRPNRKRMTRDPLTLDTRCTTGQRDGMAIADSSEITLEELQLSGRNHSIPLEALKHDITPIGLHYLLTHFDIPNVDVETWQLAVGGLVEKSLTLTLADVKARPARTMAVTLECAGNGRALIEPRPMSQPWLQGAVCTAEWTGTPLGPLLEEGGLAAEAKEIVFSGLDRGIQGDLEHAYERSLPVAEAQRDEILLAYEINAQPLTPQPGFPLRLIVPGWYGMTHVKWLRSITAVAEPFTGWQQDVAYHVRESEEEQGEPVTLITPRWLMVPPGIPEFLSRPRYVAPGPCEVEGRAWSGRAPVSRIEFSADSGETGGDATLDEPVGDVAW